MVKLTSNLCNLTTKGRSQQIAIEFGVDWIKNVNSVIVERRGSRRERTFYVANLDTSFSSSSLLCIRDRDRIPSTTTLPAPVDKNTGRPDVSPNE